MIFRKFLDFGLRITNNYRYLVFYIPELLVIFVVLLSVQFFPVYFKLIIVKIWLDL